MYLELRMKKEKAVELEEKLDEVSEKIIEENL